MRRATAYLFTAYGQKHVTRRVHLYMLSDSTQWAESMTVAMSMLLLYGRSTGPPRMEVCMFD